jgi:AraC family transcriptional regulator
MSGKNDSPSIHRVERQSGVPGFTSPTRSSEGAPWVGISVEAFEFDEPTFAPAMSFPNLYVCVLHHGTGLQWTEHQRDAKVLSRGHITIVPAGLVHGGSNPEPSAWTSIYLKPSLIAQAAADLLNPDSVEIIPQIELDDSQICHVVEALEAEIHDGFGSGRLFGESLGIALAGRLLARYAVKPLTAREYRGGMPKYLLRRTVDYMQSNLGADLRLAELAANVDMSRWHFCRMFKQSTGLSPHQYLMRERVDAAMTRLGSTQADMEKIAAELGFSDQSHFITVFRRFAGVTPTQYNKAAWKLGR